MRRIQVGGARDQTYAFFVPMIGFGLLHQFVRVDERILAQAPHPAIDVKRAVEWCEAKLREKLKPTLSTRR